MTTHPIEIEIVLTACESAFAAVQARKGDGGGSRPPSLDLLWPGVANRDMISRLLHLLRTMVCSRASRGGGMRGGICRGGSTNGPMPMAWFHYSDSKQSTERKRVVTSSSSSNGIGGRGAWASVTPPSKGKSAVAPRIHDFRDRIAGEGKTGGSSATNHSGGLRLDPGTFSG